MRLTYRWTGIATEGEDILCPNGHEFDMGDTIVWNSVGLRCQHKASDGRHDCSAIMLLLGGGLRNMQGDPMFLLVEVSGTELHTMQAARMDWDRMLSFLGLSAGRPRRRNPASVGVST